MRPTIKAFELGRVVMLGVAALIGATYAIIFVEDAGYYCIEEQTTSVSRHLPWGQTEWIFFFGHMALYPIAALVGMTVASRRLEARPTMSAMGCLVSFLTASFVAMVAFGIQWRATSVFVHLDACGPVEYNFRSPAQILGWEIMILVAVASLLGLGPWLSNLLMTDSRSEDS